MYSMLVSFLGPPASGKTTLAAKLFSDMKRAGAPTELLLEQARLHIAWKRHLREKSHPVVLDDAFQRKVMYDQLRWQAALVYSAGPQTVVVTDSSPLNSLLYMQDLYDPEVVAMTQEAVETSDLVFYCAPVPDAPPDAVRVHDHAEALALDARLPGLMAQRAPQVWDGVVKLEGRFEHRYRVLRDTVAQRTGFLLLDLSW